MARRTRQLAKLTRPRLARAVARERLYKLFDEARDTGPAICVTGPPGAGKTTLVAGWLDIRNIRGIWYQVDSGDADLATFFHYLGQAAGAFTRVGQRPLPALTPEYLSDVPGFARRFFRELFRRMPHGATLVLDNYQEVAPEHLFHAVVADAVAEVPQGITLIAVSRRDTPDVYARLIANESVSFVDWQDLRLTLTEAEAIAAMRSAKLEPARVAALHAQCDGWAAGLTLLLEDRRRNPESGDMPSGTGCDAIFNYFAAQIFARVPEDLRSFLMQTAHLPQIPVSIARALTGEARTEEWLTDLYHRHLFTHRRAGAEPTYWYHALFRSFLLAQAEDLLLPNARRSIQQRAAQLLDSSGMVEDAVQLYQCVGDVEGAAALVLREASKLIAQGRWKLLLEWIEALPSGRVQGDCWLMFWLGTASIAISPLAARDKLECSFDLAECAGDALCQLHAAAGIIENYMSQYTHFRPLDRWIVVLENKLPGHSTFPDPDVELRIQSALLMALATRQPGNPRLAWCVERIFALLRVCSDVNLQVSAAMHLVFYGASTGPVEIGRRAQLHLDAIVSRPEVMAVNAGWAYTALSWFHCLCHNVAACQSASEHAEHIGEEHGLPWLTRLGVINRMWLELFKFDAANGRTWVARVESITDQSHPFDRAQLHGAKAWLALCEDRPDVALDHALKSVSTFDEAGSAMQCINFRIQPVIALFMVGEFHQARQWAQQMRELAATDYQQSAVFMWEANIALAEGDRGLMREKLTQALGLAKRTGTGFIFYDWTRRWMPQLCLEALQAGIEMSYVHELIRDYDFAPPFLNATLWPWPVRIRTLGQFAILREGKAVQFGRKAPRRVLAVLKYMVAQGATGIALRQLADALWPDLEGDAALRALGVAAARLRKLLGGYDTLIINDERASINQDRVWIDTGALEEVFVETNGAKLVSDGILLVEAVDRLLSLYCGDFLPADRDEPWALRPRLQIRARFIRCLGSLGARLEALGHWDRAIECYRRALEIDDLAEEFYQGLMRCYGRLAQPAEALAVFERLKQTLLGGLGVIPSTASETLARDLHAQYRLG